LSPCYAIEVTVAVTEMVQAGLLTEKGYIVLDRENLSPCYAIEVTVAVTEMVQARVTVNMAMYEVTRK